MIEAILFDLDGTLLANDLDRFIVHYLHALSAAMSPFMAPEKFTQYLLAATDSAVANRDPTTTNEDAFRMAFDALSPCPINDMLPAINAFYATEFGKLRAHTLCRPEAREIVELLLEMGKQVVVATNPIFPLTAIEQRMDWAGVADLPFSLITSYENMHFTKPRPEYFDEIADRIGVPAAHCLMVGDDLKLDRPAVDAGMRFYWLTEEEPPGEMRGTLSHFRARLVDGLLDA